MSLTHQHTFPLNLHMSFESNVSFDAGLSFAHGLGWSLFAEIVGVAYFPASLSQSFLVTLNQTHSTPTNLPTNTHTHTQSIVD